MRKFFSAIAASCLAASALTVLPATSASSSALPQHNHALNVVLIGDSYSAGNGAGKYEEGADGTSYRSTINWANNYVRWLNSQGIHSTLTNLAYSGSVTNDLLAEGGQIDRIPSNTDLVLLTIGGNDVEFASIVKQCFVPALRSPNGCKEQIDKADSLLSTVSSQTTQVFQRLEDRLPENAEVVLLSYPLLSTDANYVLSRCIERPFIKCTKYETYNASDDVRALGLKAVNTQNNVVYDWNTSHRLKVSYVDSMPSFFHGQEPDPFAIKYNPYRWVNELVETEGEVTASGETDAKWSRDTNNWYHPNRIGHRKMAEALQQSYGTPDSSRPIVSTGGDIDIVFAIDATGSMSDEIDTVKNNVRHIATKIQANSKSYRFGLVTYKDHPSAGGNSRDYPAQLELDFTTDLSAFTDALDAINVDGGGDTPEAVYSGIMKGLDLSWRPGVRKILLTLGDAEPKDPEPVTGYTHTQVAKRAFDIDPVEVYALNAGWMMSSEMEALVKQTNGAAFDVTAGEELANTIVTAIDTALAKPFAWLQGPLSGVVGEEIILDARGSYAYDGPLANYDWDFDGDGTYETTTTEGIIAHVYSSEFTGVAGVRVTAADGQKAVGSAPVHVSVDPGEPEDKSSPDMIPAEGIYESVEGEPMPFPLAPNAVRINLNGTSVDGPQSQAPGVSSPSISSPSISSGGAQTPNATQPDTKAPIPQAKPQKDTLKPTPKNVKASAKSTLAGTGADSLTLVIAVAGILLVAGLIIFIYRWTKRR